MKKQFYLFTLILFGGVVFGQKLSSNNILYVKNGAGTGDTNGDSWSNAYGNLSKALYFTRNNNNATSNNPIKIYVAKGEYIPTTKPNDDDDDDSQDAAFKIYKNVWVYGGFDPDTGIINPEQRTFSSTTTTTLSGNNDKYHVVTVYDGDTNTVLDGVSITKGKADGNNDLSGMNRKYGGAIYVDESKLLVKNCKVFNNYAKERGGAFYVEGGDGEIKAVNTFFYNNTCDGDGSAFFSRSGSSGYVINCTFINNVSNTNGNGGPLHVDDGNFYVYNTILWNNTRNNGTITGFTGGNSNDFNIDKIILNPNSEGHYNNVESNVINYDPQFVSISGNDIHLKSMSPAINAGNNAYISAYGINKDFYGNTRVIDSTIDIGASEATYKITAATGNIIYVDKNVSLGNGDGSTWANSINDLADVLQWAERNKTTFTNTSPLSVYVAGSTAGLNYSPAYHPNTLVQTTGDDEKFETFKMVNNVNIYGGFSPSNNITTLSQRKPLTYKTILNGSDKSHTIVAAGTSTNNVLIDGFHIQSGIADGGDGIDINGEGISANYGGGLYVDNAKLKIKNTVFTNNKAKQRGGAVYVEGSNADLKIINGLFYNNTVTDGEGSAVYTSSAKTYLVNTTITKNTSTSGNGGAIHVKDDGHTYVYNSILWNNMMGTNIRNMTGGEDNDFDVDNSIINAGTNDDSGDGHNDGENGGKINFMSYDPQFTNSASNDFSLKTLSPAASTAGEEYYNTNAGTSIENDIDLAGNSRKAGVYIDMGALEKSNPAWSDNDNILYVNGSLSSTSGVGTSWSTAIISLADAVKWAKQHNRFNPFSNSNPLKIYVASGTYSPAYNPTDLESGTDERDRSFLMSKNVHLYGSFAPNNGITELSQRNLTGNYVTIIDAKSYYHGVIAAGDASENSKMDGFSFVNGYADGTGSLKVHNIDINRDKGGAFYVVGTESDANKVSLTLKNIISKNNVAKTRGAFMNADKSGTTVNLTNVLAYDNSLLDGSDGGSVIFSNDKAKVTILNSTLVNNDSKSENGGALHVASDGTFEVYNSILWDNIRKDGQFASLTGGEDNDFIVWNTILNEDSNKGTDTHNNGENGGKINFITYKPQFVNQTLRDYKLLKGVNPAIEQGEDQYYLNKSNGVTTASDVDLAGNPRFIPIMYI